MLGYPFDHGDIARRQFFSLPLSPSGLGEIVPFSLTNPVYPSAAAAATQSSGSSSSSSSSTSVSLSTVPLSSSVTSSSTVSSTSSSPSPTPLATHPSPSPTPTPTLISSTSVFTSSSDGNVIAITSVVPASVSSDAAATVPKSFLQNKPLVAGVFTVVGIIGVAILILIGTMWIRSASRRRLNREALDASAFDPAAIVRDDNEKISLEKLRRVNSTGSSGFSHTAGQAGVGRGGYPTSPVAQLAPHNYRQTLPYQGQPPEGPNYDGRYPTYLPPRSLDLVYGPARTAPPPHVNIIAPTPSTVSYFGDETSPVRPLSQNMPPTPQLGGSLLNSPPVSPSGPGENVAVHTRGSSSYSRTLDMQEMPVAPPLPAKFGSDENEDEDGEAYGGIGSDHGHEIPRSLKVANQ